MTLNRKKRILVVEDHAMVREGFIALINQTDDLEVCAEADNVLDAMKAIASSRPDLMIIDIVLKKGDGIDLIKASRSQYHRLPLLVVSMQDEYVYAERTLRAGAMGYIMKQEASGKLLEGIRAVLTGNIYVSRNINLRMLQAVTGRAPATDGSIVSTLSDRELQVFQMIGTGMASREIGASLGISSKTVDTHRENIKLKLQLKNAAELMSSAVQWIHSGS
jgi:DNA-binding NarL/FixJ family response regulator